MKWCMEVREAIPPASLSMAEFQSVSQVGGGASLSSTSRTEQKVCHKVFA